ncbi:hypothetical protein [Nocardioides sp.]|uniref:hypothetical protein n=1 Tax=Nocardioides sp. TaxID=35761 RepID=UPI003D12CF37
MGNLGAYQTMTSLAKKVGGPKALAVMIAASGWAVGRGTEAGGKYGFKATKAALKRRNAPCPTKGLLFDVTADGTDSGAGLTLHLGDSYRVLECDEDAILIEVLDNATNPYFVSRQFLTTVSDFPTDDATAGD